MTQSPFPQISGYTLTELLYEGSRAAVYRAVQKTTQRAVVIKLLRADYPSFNELVQFRNQYAVARNLDISGVVRPLSLEPYRQGYALIVADDGSISLERYQPQPLSILAALQIALQLAEILHHLHAERVIHKDIKPANILIHPETQRVKLIDFSISSLLPRETQTLQNPDVLEGTLAYIAPEQTGRMNRAIDYRSDYYSLGVTLYQLLTGELPFQGKDALELIHCHIAQSPTNPSLINPEIPTALSKIVLKLMAKNAEDRYQSALGLKADLSLCLEQWQASGAVAEFELEQQFFNERFTIPEKLYGRETEISQLLTAFEKARLGTPELMLVAGFSGVGKTAIINEIHKPIVRQKGYFIKGKFEQLQQNIPFYAFGQAFNFLVQQLLSEPDDCLQNWREKILEAAGENGEILIEVIPEIVKIIGPQPPALKLSGLAAQNRFNSLFQNFVRIFSRPEHPLVLFLDDLQWADSASLSLLKQLLEDTGSLLILGAYRDNEVSPAHLLMLTLAEIEKMGAEIQTLTLSPLSETDLNHLLADTLNCASELAQPLTALVYQKTQGNPFFATQFLKALHDDKLIFPRPADGHSDRGGWQCNLAAIAPLATTDNVVEFMGAQLQKLPPKTQNLLELAACIGARFDLNTLSIISEESATETAAQLWSALQEGLILPTANIYKFFLPGEGHEAVAPTENPTYQFLHDRVQQAAYSLIPAEERQATHLRIGRLLQQKFSQNEREENLFDLLEHLNRSCEFITEPEERENLARLNLAAGRRARDATAYAAARQYFQIGIEFLSERLWETQYELTLALFVAATEAAYLNGDFKGLELLAETALQSAKTPLDKAKIYEIQLDAHTARGEMLQAVELGLTALQGLGIHLPSQPDASQIEQSLHHLIQQMHNREIEELINLPLMTDSSTLVAMQLLYKSIGATIQGNPLLIPLLSGTMIELSLQFGNAPASALGYVTAGMSFSVFLNQVETGYRLGKLALNLLERLNARELKSRTTVIFTFFIQHRRDYFGEIIPLAREAYLIGLEVGDFLGAGYSLTCLTDNSIFIQKPLDEWGRELDDYCQVMERMNQDSPAEHLRIKQRYIQNLQDVLERPDLLSGEFYDETVRLAKSLEDGDGMRFAMAIFYKLLLAYLFNLHLNAREYIETIGDNINALAGMPSFPVFHSYAALNQLALLPSATVGEPASEAQPEAQTAAFNRVAAHQAILQQWAADAPVNYRHKVTLIEAEKARVLGKNIEASELYDRAIAEAQSGQFYQDEGIANERAAQFYLNWGKEKIAQSYLQQAYYCYARWGATAKLAQLEQNYPQLLQLVQSQGTAEESLHSTHRSGSQATSSENLRLDFIAVLTAAQAISQEIELDKLLAKLLQIAATTAGAESGLLIVARDGEWVVAAKSLVSKTELLNQPLPQATDLPQALIYSALRASKTAAFDDLSRVEKFASDPYILASQPKSALALPIEIQGKPTGLLYLENNLITGAFSRSRVQILQILASQAAISLENARLYQQVAQYSHTLEAEVERKTEALNRKAIDLEQALHNLQKTQSQLIQSEKMSALGQLVAGVAHEINNPVNFILGNLIHAESYFDKLLEVIETYDQNSPQLRNVLQDDLEEIDFIRQDFPPILESMKRGSERIKEIVLNLRNFSRLDEAEIKSVDLHVGIESTLFLLQNRLQATEGRPEIRIYKNYGELPIVTCYASEMNQVFLSLLGNAVDACRGATEPTIEIKTETLDSQTVKIAVADNGLGIVAKNLERIFDPFFTTKPVGSGTGLGLTVSYEIIKKHGGKLSCDSTPNRGSVFIIEMPIHLQSRQ